jgi:hypothetical protein
LQAFSQMNLSDEPEISCKQLNLFDL